MASSEDQVIGGPATDDGFTYPEEDLVDGEALGPEVVDPGLTTSKQLKEEAEEEEEQKGETESGEGKGMEKLKRTLVISGAVVAVIGAIFAIAKKIIREA